MNAVEFVRNEGWDVAQETVKENSKQLRILSTWEVELKRLVESWELISKQYDGLENAKELLRISPKLTEEIRFLDQAIRDVESVGGGV